MTIDEFRCFLERPIVVAYLSTANCNVCKVLRPKVEECVSPYDGVDFLYIDTEKSPEIAGQNMVFAVPTILIFIHGREFRRWSRNLTIQDLEESLQRAITFSEESNEGL